MKPLISIVVPNYNHAAYLSTAIQSILNQDFNNFELIVIEDGSKDNSLEIIQSFCKKDARIKLIRHIQNRGIYCSVNEGLEMAKGEYFHVLGADDLYMPRFLSTSLSFLLKNPKKMMTACDACYYHVSVQEPLEELRFIPEQKSSCFLKPNMAVHMLQSTFLKFSGTNTIAKTALVKEYGGYDAKLNASCDWIVATKIALTYGVIYIPEPLVCFRKNMSGVSGSALCNKELRRRMYAHVLEDISHCPRPLFNNFKLSGELGCVIKYAPMEFLKRPKFWPFFPPILKRFIRRQRKRKNLQKSETKGNVGPHIGA